MKAMLIRKYGGPEVFEYGDIELPEIEENEVLVKVEGSSVNPVDAGIRKGMLKSFVRLQLPAVLGVDAAGEVVKVGKMVTHFNKGDKVYAFSGIRKNGGYAEYIAIPESYVAHSPKNIPIDEVGTVPGVGMTAMEAFSIHAPLKPGMKVLINGASGGVGTYAVQIAKYYGAVVTAVCAQRNIPLVKELGATVAVDYATENILETSERFDVILNSVRANNNLRFKKLLKPGGKLLVIAGNPPEIILLKISNLFSSKKAKMFFVKTSGNILRQLTGLIETGKVRPVIEKIYSLKELAAAHKHMENGKVTGKIAIKVE